jgi:hypothetical protein
MTPLLIALVLDLRLTASSEGLRVRATLHNDSDSPAQVVLRDACAGPLLTMLVDGNLQSFATTGHKCVARQPVTETLAPRGQASLLSDTLDGRLHHVVVKWNALSSEMVVVAALERIDLALTMAPRARAGEPIAFEIAHVNHSAGDVTIPACGEDRLLVDDDAGPLPDAAPCPHEARTLARDGAVLTRGKIRLGKGKHVLRALWRDRRSEPVTVDVQ